MLDLIERGTLPPATPSTVLARYRAADDYDRANSEFDILGPRLLPGMR